MKWKIISFLLGCIIGGLIGGYQISAWAYPIGYKEFDTYAMADPEQYMEENYVDIPLEVSESCEKYGEEYGICPEVGEGLCWRETRCQSDAENGNCKGVAQIDVKVHKDRLKRLGITNIYDTDQNIHVMFDLLKELYEQEKDLAKSLDAYNGNGKNGKSKYAKDILTVSAALEMTGGD